MPQRKFLLLALLAGPAFGHVAVNVQVGDPGYYGPLVVEERLAPALVYPQPVVGRGVTRNEPLFLRVPPGHVKHWDKHCADYRACGQPVYFVRDDWYHEVYVPTYHGKKPKKPKHDKAKHGHHEE